MKAIEHLYTSSHNEPVVILCHSMGCKTGHYLFNFVLNHLGKADGQAWLDRYIHSYVPVGAPHLGAPKSIRGVVDGDKMGLDAFLDDEEGLMLGRSLGSTPWLFPLDSSKEDGTKNSQPQSMPEATGTTTRLQPIPMPTAILRNESLLKISIPAQCLHLKSFVHNR